jgi:hypothetical protein
MNKFLAHLNIDNDGEWYRSEGDDFLSFKRKTYFKEMCSKALTS